MGASDIAHRLAQKGVMDIDADQFHRRTILRSLAHAPMFLRFT